jgi:hypothetical protein
MQKLKPVEMAVTIGDYSTPIETLLHSEAVTDQPSCTG